MNSCNCCFTDYLAKCETEIVINTTLTPSTTYRLVITDKFDHKYEVTVVAGLTGELTIPVEDLPAGMLTQYSGDFLLQIYDNSCGPIKFKLLGEYDCLTFNIRGGTFVKNEIGCENVCSGAGTSNVLIEFTDAATVSIDYSTYMDDFGNNPIVQVYHEITPGVYQLVSVAISQIRDNGILTDIDVDNAGPATGYVLIS